MIMLDLHSSIAYFLEQRGPHDQSVVVLISENLCDRIRKCQPQPYHQAWFDGAHNVIIIFAVTLRGRQLT